VAVKARTLLLRNVMLVAMLLRVKLAFYSRLGNRVSGMYCIVSRSLSSTSF